MPSDFEHRSKQMGLSICPGRGGWGTGLLEGRALRRFSAGAVYNLQIGVP